MAAKKVPDFTRNPWIVRDGPLPGLARNAVSLIPLPVRRQAFFLYRHHRFFPRRPRTFSEKVQWRILHDRRDIIAVGGDKIAMKEYVAGLGLDLGIPRTLWHGEDLRAVQDHDWGCEWVLKPVTGSGYALFGSGSLRGSGTDLDEVGRWRADDAHRIYGEWHYSRSRPGFLLEQRIPTRDGASPDDYRFFVFGGRVHVVQVDTPRVAKVQRRFYTRDWAPLDVRLTGMDLAAAVPPPPTLGRMVELAERIGAAYDFIRVDLYDADGTVWFGELTPTPGGGLPPFDPPEFDLELGRQWELPALGRRGRG
ncbi:ATP-grasp fold amidoligase family protein [Kocuria kalidii]|uniref:ATP-grasp fold amidoligase family protein n=1 Tax=Kocuria kalidii TaxID=3376283 RepID=UPI0037A28C3D